MRSRGRDCFIVFSAVGEEIEIELHIDIWIRAAHTTKKSQKRDLCLSIPSALQMQKGA